MKHFIAFSLLASIVSSSLATDTWVEVEYNETQTPVVANLTIFSDEVTQTSPGIWSVNLSRTILKKSPVGAITEMPAWVADLTPIGYVSQTKELVESNIVAPNGITPKMAYTNFDMYQRFRLFEDGSPTRDFAVRTGQANKSYTLYYLVNP